MPYGEILSETKTYSNPYKFNGKELDTETGLAYYGARYYSPELGVWYGCDPLMEKYPASSPYVFCAGNPVKLVDPDGRKIIISGENKEKAFEQLSKAAGDILLLSMSDNGEIAYSKTQDKIKGYAKKITKIIDDKFINVELKTTKGDKTSQGRLMIGGAFMGNEIKKDDQGRVISVWAIQEINPDVLAKSDEYTDTPGKMLMHELTESYYGGRISKRNGVNSPSSDSHDSVYNQAHILATPQTDVYQTIYNSKGEIIDQGVPGATRVEWFVFGKNNKKGIIQTLK